MPATVKDVWPRAWRKLSDTIKNGDKTTWGKNELMAQMHASIEAAMDELSADDEKGI